MRKQPRHRMQPKNGSRYAPLRKSTGAVAGQLYVPGAAAGSAFVPGADAGQVAGAAKPQQQRRTTRGGRR